MTDVKTEYDEMKRVTEAHNIELHNNAGRVTALVNEANEKSISIQESLAKIAETELQLDNLTAELNVFGFKQEAVITEQTAKLAAPGLCVDPTGVVC